MNAKEARQLVEKAKKEKERTEENARKLERLYERIREAAKEEKYEIKIKCREIEFEHEKILEKDGFIINALLDRPPDPAGIENRKIAGYTISWEIVQRNDYAN